MNKYAFFDIDQTIYDGYSTPDFYFYLNKLGLGGSWVVKRDKEIEEQYFGGKIDYSETSTQVIQLLADVVKGRSMSAIEKMGKAFMSEKERFFPWIREVLALLDKHDFLINLISASASPVVEAIADYLDVDKYYSSELEKIDGKYTGKIVGMLNDDKKSQTVQGIISQLPEKKMLIGFGDSTGDVEMLKIMDAVFVVNPHQEEMRTISQKYRWQIVNNQNMLSTLKQVIKR